MSDLSAQIQADMKTAMREKDKVRLGTIRLIMAAIKQREVDEKITLDDAQVLSVLDKMLKQRRDSIEQYEKANRPELAAQEVVEMDVIQTYLPQPLTTAEIDALIASAFAAVEGTGMQAMGQVMAILKPQMQGKADMGAVSRQVKDQLSS